MAYKVLVDELTVHQTVAKLPQPDGSTIYQNGLGETYYRDEVIPDDKVAEDWREALDSGEGPLNDSLSKVLEKSSDEGRAALLRLGVPFAGYDDMEEDDVLNAMKSLPSAAIQRDQGVRGSSVTTRVSASLATASDSGSPPSTARKEGCQATCRTPTRASRVARINVREVPEEGPVVPGEGITGTGDPQHPTDRGRATKTRQARRATSRARVRPRRRGRRDRQPKPQEGSGEPSLTKSERVVLTTIESQIMSVEEPAVSPIALAARDELPETWAALLAAPTFGKAALDRRLDTLMYRAFGTVLDSRRAGRPCHQ